MAFEVDFLAVGDGEKSGDAITLRFSHPNPRNDDQVVIVIDGGFTDDGTDLVNHIRTYYGTERVDLVISTHPDNDHLRGLKVVVEELNVGELLMHLPWQHSKNIASGMAFGRVISSDFRKKVRASLEAACDVEQIARRRGIPVTEPFAGLSRFGGVVTFVGPTRDYYEELAHQFRGISATKALEAKLASAGLLKRALHRVLETFDIETLDDSGVTSPENNSSVITQLACDGYRLLFTGDAGIPALERASDFIIASQLDLEDLRFIQIPHHGSRRNVGPSVLNELVGKPGGRPSGTLTAFVSASQAALKHPHRQVTNAFIRRGANVFSTEGKGVWHQNGAPDRLNWGPATPIPFETDIEVEE